LRVSSWWLPEVPFADIGGVVAAPGEDVAETFVLRTEAQFVDHHAGAGLIFSGEQRRAIGRADGRAGDGVADVERFAGEAVNVGCAREFVAGIAAGESAQLVGEDVDEVDRPVAILRQPRRGGLCEECAAAERVEVHGSSRVS